MSVMKCKECGKIMTKLPTTATCLNTACSKAGQLIPREVTKETGADNRICRVCDGGPGNNGVCLCGLHDYEVVQLIKEREG